MFTQIAGDMVAVLYLVLIAFFGFTGFLGGMCAWGATTSVRGWIREKKVETPFTTAIMGLAGITFCLVTIFGVYETIIKMVIR